MERRILPRPTFNSVQPQPLHPPTFIVGQYQHPPSNFGVVQHGQNLTGPFQNLVSNSVATTVEPSTQLRESNRSSEMHVGFQASPQPTALHADPDTRSLQQPNILGGENNPDDTLNRDENPRTANSTLLQPIPSSQVTNQVSDDQQRGCGTVPATNHPLVHQPVNHGNHTTRINQPTRGRGRGSSRARGSRSLRGRARNLLPSILRSRSGNNSGLSSPSVLTRISPELLSFHEMVRSNFRQQNEIMKSIRDSIVEVNTRQHEREIVRNCIVPEEDIPVDTMTTLSNCLCSLFQLFILSSFVGKAPLWYTFPSDEKENDLLTLCASFFKSRDNGANLSLDMENISIHEFLDGDTMYGRRGVIAWKRRGELNITGNKKDVTSLRIRLRRLRTRIHDDVTKTVLRSFFAKVPEFQSLRLGVKYAYINAAAREKALEYCLEKQDKGIDPLTNGEWNMAYTEAIDTFIHYTRHKLKKLYNKIGYVLSLPQMNSVSLYFKSYYSERYNRSVPLLIFESRRRNPSILEAYIATKVRCRLADIATWVAKEKNINHLPFFEVSHCESHFIPILGDLLNLTKKQNASPLQMRIGYGTNCERISAEEFEWAKRQYDRVITISVDYLANAENAGLNLLASVVETPSGAFTGHSNQDRDEIEMIRETIVPVRATAQSMSSFESISD